jgi:hypothetical protein
MIIPFFCGHLWREVASVLHAGSGDMPSIVISPNVTIVRQAACILGGSFEYVAADISPRKTTAAFCLCVAFIFHP